MKLPLEITFRNLDPSPALNADIRARAEKLELFYNSIMRCHVVLEAQHKHHHKGNLYHVRIDLTVPGDEIVVSRSPGADHSHEDAYVAIRDAFNAARRQLENFARRRKQNVKTHAVPAHGKVVYLAPTEDYGKIQTSDGREVYFHRNSVINADFESLDIGNELRFNEEDGDEGPQASTVRVIGKHHIAEEITGH